MGRRYPRHMTIAKLRRLYAIFVATLAVIGAVATVLLPFGVFDALTDPVYVMVPVAVVVGVSISAFLRRARVVARDERSAAMEFTARTLVRMALAEAPMMVGFALSFVGDGGAIRYWAAVVIAALPFALAAPSDRALDSFQTRLIDAGIPVDIRAALG